jgi:hypothetical protein
VFISASFGCKEKFKEKKNQKGAKKKQKATETAKQSCTALNTGK